MLEEVLMDADGAPAPELTDGATDAELLVVTTVGEGFEAKSTPELLDAGVKVLFR